MGTKTESVEPIVLATEEELLSMAFIIALAVKIVWLGLSRLKATAWLDDTLNSWPFGIINADGTPFILYPDIIDDAYGHEESFSWNSAVKRFAKQRPRRNPNKKLLVRLKLWDAAFKIYGDPIVLPLED